MFTVGPYLTHICMTARLSVPSNGMSSPETRSMRLPPSLPRRKSYPRVGACCDRQRRLVDIGKLESDPLERRAARGHDFALSFPRFGIVCPSATSYSTPFLEKAFCKIGMPVQMPAGIPVGTLAIGKAGAINAALLAASVLALSDPALSGRLAAWRQQQTDAVKDHPEGTA